MRKARERLEAKYPRQTILSMELMTGEEWENELVSDEDRVCIKCDEDIGIKFFDFGRIWVVAE